MNKKKNLTGKGKYMVKVMYQLLKKQVKFEKQKL